MIDSVLSWLDSITGWIDNSIASICLFGEYPSPKEEDYE